MHPTRLLTTAPAMRQPLPALRQLASLLLGTALACTVMAQNMPGGHAPTAPLADPTRPPPALIRTTPRSETTTPGITTGVSPVPTRNAVRVPPVPPRLQGLLRPRDGQASALIDGLVLRRGDRLGEWIVQEIGSDSVLLRHPRGANQRLALLPALNSDAAPATPGEPGNPLHLATTTAR